LCRSPNFNCWLFSSRYPPIWAPMLWTICGLLIAAHLARRRVFGAFPVLAAVVAGAVVGLAYHLPYRALIVDTAYPGRRVAEAGSLPLLRLVDLLWPCLC